MAAPGKYGALLISINVLAAIAVFGVVKMKGSTNEALQATMILGFIGQMVITCVGLFRGDQQQIKTRHDSKSDITAVLLSTGETAKTVESVQSKVEKVETKVEAVQHEVARLANYTNGRLQAAVNAANDAVEEEGRSMQLNQEGINRLKDTWVATMQHHLAQTQVSNTGEGI